MLGNKRDAVLNAATSAGIRFRPFERADKYVDGYIFQDASFYGENIRFCPLADQPSAADSDQSRKRCEEGEERNLR
mgnify:CR=1 FL=1